MDKFIKKEIELQTLNQEVECLNSLKIVKKIGQYLIRKIPVFSDLPCN